MSNVESRLAELGIQLPQVAVPAGAYVPAVLTGSYVYTSGQLPLVEGKLAGTGKVGSNIDVEQATRLAEHCTSTLWPRSRRSPATSIASSVW